MYLTYINKILGTYISFYKREKMYAYYVDINLQ